LHIVNRSIIIFTWNLTLGDRLGSPGDQPIYPGVLFLSYFYTVYAIENVSVSAWISL